MSRDVITVGSTIRISLLYWGEYSQWRERFINYLEEQTDGEAMINSIQNGDQPLPVIAQVYLVGTAQNAPPTLKDPKFWTVEEKKSRKIDRLARSLLIQGLSNDIYSLIDSNKTDKDLWDALERQMRGSEYGEQDMKAKCGYKKDNYELIYKFFNNLQQEWKQDVNDSLGYKKKAVMVHSDLLALVTEKTNAFNQRKVYSKPTNNNLRTSSTSQSANKKQEFVKSDDKKEDKKADENKRDMSKVKCYNCKKEGHFSKDCKKVEVKDYNYYKTKILKSMQAWSLWLKLKWFFQNKTKVLHLLKKPMLSENFIKNHIDSQKDYDKSDVDYNDSEEKDNLLDKLIRKFNKKIVKCQKRVEKANQQSKDFKNQNKDLQDKYDVLKNQVNTFEEKNKEFNEKIKVLNEKNDDLLDQTKVLKD
nr:hypothetical protein [Tanacetum cinerariifolium]